MAGGALAPGASPVGALAPDAGPRGAAVPVGPLPPGAGVPMGPLAARARARARARGASVRVGALAGGAAVLVVASEDLVCRPSWLQSTAMACLNNFVEPLSNYWPMYKWREKALINLMQHIHYEDETSYYVGLCPVNKALTMICCWIEKPNSIEFRQHLPRIYDFMWLAEDGMKSKVMHNMPNYKNHYRERTKGAWTLGNGENGWTGADCTAEALKNKDGTLSSVESKRTAAWVEVSMFINPSESFRNIIVDYPYVECTSSLIQALILFRGMHPEYRREEMEKIIIKAAKFIEKMQQKDGSWYGSWALCFTYATFFAIKGLVAAGRTYQNSLSIQKACNFLLSKQIMSGGWGENYLSCHSEEYIDSGSPHAVNTAWAMLGLIYAGQMERDTKPLHRAAKELIKMQLETGEFPQQDVVGNFNSSLFFNYPNYRNLFPIWALGEFHCQLHGKTG
ncbi:hypothetical protein EJB05_23056, partial [Eragrostis curvula]